MITVKIKRDSVKAETKEPKKTLKIEMKVSKTSEGNLLVRDHSLFDIMIVPKTSKVVTIPRDKDYKLNYTFQREMLHRLMRDGLIKLGSIRSSSVFGTYEGAFHNNSEVMNTSKAILLSLKRIIKSQNERIANLRKSSNMTIDRMIDPSADESTELGEIPHDSEKGNQPNDYYYTRRYNMGLFESYVAKKIGL